MSDGLVDTQGAMTLLMKNQGVGLVRLEVGNVVGNLKLVRLVKTTIDVEDVASGNCMANICEDATVTKEPMIASIQSYSAS